MISIGQQEVVKLQVAQEMLFVWPESGAMAALEAANKEPVLSPHMTKQVHMPSLTLLFGPNQSLQQRNLLACAAALAQQTDESHHIELRGC